MDKSFNFIVVIVSQCVRTSQWQIVLLKYIQFLFVKDISTTLSKRKKRNKNNKEQLGAKYTFWKSIYFLLSYPEIIFHRKQVNHNSCRSQSQDQVKLKYFPEHPIYGSPTKQASLVQNLSSKMIRNISPMSGLESPIVLVEYTYCVGLKVVVPLIRDSFW